MADSFTTNLNLTKPEVSASANTWGTKINAGLDSVDSEFAKSYNGNPNTNVVGVYVGQQLYDTANNILYICDTAGNAANAVWVATKASQWANARTIALTGDVTGSVAIDGTQNVSITATLAGQVDLTGAIQMWGGASAPNASWKICNGEAISRSTYSDLFAIIGVAYGGGDGSNTFNIPNLESKIPMGKSGSYALASTGGANEVTPSGTISAITPAGSVATTIGGNTGGHAITQAQLPNLTLKTSEYVKIEEASLSPPNGDGLGLRGSSSGNGAAYNKADVLTGGSDQAHSHSASGLTGSSSFSGNAVTPTFSGATSSVIQPYLALNYIIRL